MCDRPLTSGLAGLLFQSFIGGWPPRLSCRRPSQLAGPQHTVNELIRGKYLRSDPESNPKS